MKIKNLLFLSLLLALMAGNVKAQEPNPNIILSEDFEKVPENMEDWGWTVINFDEYATTEIVTDFGHDSDSCFYVSSLYYDGCYLVSPLLTATTGINVEFWCTNRYFGSASFKVGYITDNTYNLNDFDPDEFEWGEVITANKGNIPEGIEEGWMPYNGEFPEGTAYIAIAFVKLLSHFYLDDIVFKEVTCGRPSVPEIEEGKNSLTLTWTGNSDNYELQYKAGYSTTFDNGLEGWTTYIDYEYDDDEEKDSTWIVMDNCVYSTSFGDDGVSEPTQFYTDNYLVSPSVELGGSITFWAKGYDMWAYEDEHFGVAVYNSDDEIFEVISEWTAESEWTRYSVDLTNYKGEGYVAIVHLRSEGSDPDLLRGILVDNITIFTSNDWNLKNIVFSNQKTTEREYTLGGLMRETTYALQLCSVCGANEYSSWTDMVFASTKDNYRFIHAGGWNEPGNWEGGVAPVEGVAYDDVTILANVTIPDNCVAVADNINVKFGRTITIADGGQLKHNNEGVEVTLQKGIVGYTFEQGTTENPTNGWYLLSFPVKVWDGDAYAVIQPDQVVNLKEDTYDLFKFAPWNNGGEWINYKNEENSSEFEYSIITDGYLYANSGDVTLEFTGVVNPMNPEQADEQMVSLMNNTANVNYGSWNLVGNPQVYEVYPIVVNTEEVDVEAKAYYRMNGSFTDLMVGQGAIHPLEGVFMQCEGEEQTVRFSAMPYEAPDLAATQGGITLNLTKEQNKVIDRAMVRFGEGSLMGKMMLNPNNTHICIPQSGKEYAVVRGEGEGEMPVNFKAAENGIYTLTAEVNDADMDYLRLIDNLTGANVDLLRQPSYSFEAAKTDYASRFKLVFSTSDNNNASSSSIFAYFNGSNWTVNNTGEATLQVIDVLGRVVSTETINGDAEINLSQSEGVYMLRLVNSDSVKVQKVVVR